MTDEKPRINNLDVSDARVIRRAEESHEFAVEWIKATLEDDASTVATLRAERDELRKLLVKHRQLIASSISDIALVKEAPTTGHADRQNYQVKFDYMTRLLEEIDAALSTKGDGDGD